MSASANPALSELAIADPPSAWADLGFAVAGETLSLGDVRLRLGAPGEGIVGWALTGIAPVDAIDGLPTSVRRGGGDRAPVEHPNGAIGLDHVVITTPAFDRTAAALDDVGLPLRRIRTVGSGEKAFRQGFRRIGPAILELVELAGQDPVGPSRFWGLVAIVSDIDALAASLGPERCTEPKPAVQPGRRIATLRRGAGLSPAFGFMTPE